MQISPLRHWARITQGILGFSIGCWLALMPLSSNAQLRGSEFDPGYPSIPGKIPPSILKMISTIHPGTTRAAFSKFFDGYAPGVSNIPILEVGSSPWVFHYAYRLAYVPFREEDTHSYSRQLLLLKQHPDQMHWVYSQMNGHAEGYVGFLILIDVRWKFARGARHNDIFQGTDAAGNPNDVIIRISKPYLVYDVGISA